MPVALERAAGLGGEHGARAVAHDEERIAGGDIEHRPRLPLEHGVDLVTELARSAGPATDAREVRAEPFAA